MRRIGILSLAFTCFLLLSGTTILAQEADTLFYGDTPILYENPFGDGYIAGTNAYGDIGKYQRFDFAGDVTLLGAKLYFGIMEIVDDPDPITIVVREVTSNGQPGDIIASTEITSDQITVGLDGNDVAFDDPIVLQGTNGDGPSVFIGFEWGAGADDTFAVYADEAGEGEGANRAWERFDDGSFNDFLTELNPSFSWDLDVDLWIAAVYSTVPTARLQIVHNAADPAAASVDVYVNGDTLLTGFGFREATPFVTVPADVELTVEIKPAGGTDAVGTFPVTLDDGGTYIVVANGVLDPNDFAANPDGADISFTLFLKDDAREQSSNLDEGQFFVIHGATDAPAIDILARDVDVLFEGAGYGDMTDYVSLTPDIYILDITPAGEQETVLASYFADMTGFAGGVSTVIASGFIEPDDNQGGASLRLIAVLPDGNVHFIPEYVEVETIAELRAQSYDDTVYRLTGEAVLTYQQGFRNKKWVQDETGGLEIDDPGSVIQTAYERYDGITGLTGTISMYRNLVQFTPVTDPGEATSDDNVIIPPVKTLDGITSADQSMLVKVDGVTFGQTGTFSTGTNYTITDTTGSLTFRTAFFEADYIGDDIPQRSVNLTTIVGQFDASIQLTSRDWADFEIFYDVTLNVDMSDASPFDPEADDVYVSGSFAGWPQPGTNPDLKLEPTEADSNVYTITLQLEAGEYEYKYFRVTDNTPNWDQGEWPGGDNRELSVSDDLVMNDVWGVYVPAEPVARPAFTPQAGTYYEAIEVTITTATEDATIYYTLDGTDPDENATKYSDPIPVAETITIRAVGIKDGMKNSEIVQGLFTIVYPVEVATVAELRAGEQDGTVYRLTGEAVLTFNSTFRGRKALQDMTAGIVIDDPSGIIQTEYNRYDGITGLTGRLSTFSNLIQFTPVLDPGPATSSDNNVYPERYTFADFELEEGQESSPKQGQLVIFEDVTVVETGQWATQSNYTLEDAEGNTFPIRTDRIVEVILEEGEETYLGTDIPEGPISIIGYITQFNQAIQLVPRMLDDIFDASMIGTFSLLAPADGDTIFVDGEWFDEVVVSWEEAASAQDVGYRWIATLAGGLFTVPLEMLSDNEGAATTFTSQKYELDEFLEMAGVEVGGTITVKWTVIAFTELSGRFANESFTLTMERGTITGVDERETLPTEITLRQNYPNPFNPSTIIEFALPSATQVELTVYDMLGRRVQTLVDDQLNAGIHRVNWNATSYSSGVYLYRLKAGDTVVTRRMMLVK
jgi:hypothetical protein